MINMGNKIRPAEYNFVDKSENLNKIWYKVNMKHNHFYGLYIGYNLDKHIDISYSFFDNISNKKNWLELNDREFKKINSLIPLNKSIDNNNFINFYLIGNKVDFISKLEDDYYYLFYDSEYIMCDQLDGLIKELKSRIK